MLALDEPGENDETYKQDGFTFIVGKDLMKRMEKITIDSNDNGFLINSPTLGKASCSC
jgi:hypothetical protein